MRFAFCLLAVGGWLCGIAQAQNEPAATVPTFGTTVVIPSGLKGLVYHLRHYTKQIPNLHGKKPVGTIYTTSLNIPPQDFQQGFPGVTKRFEWFAIDYTGRFWVDKPGKYRFVLTADDGANLYIDDALVVDNDGQHPPETKSGTVELSGGVHRMEVSYFQGPRFQVALVLQVAGPGQNLRVFSTDEFKPPPDPETWIYPEPAAVEKKTRPRK